MKLQIASDLHLAFSNPKDDPAILRMDDEADVLAVVGDVASIYSEPSRLRSILLHWSRHYRHVFLVPGNHEFYDTRDRLNLSAVFPTPATAVKRLRETLPENVFVFYDGTEEVILDGVRFVGATLWSYVPQEYRRHVESAINDYRYILDDLGLSVSTIDTNKWNTDQTLNLRENIEKGTGGMPTVVLTHHAPVTEGTSDPKYMGSPTNTAFSNNSPELLEKAALWVFGHTHWKCDFMRAGCRVVSNPRGYHDEVPSFDPCCIVDIPSPSE